MLNTSDVKSLSKEGTTVSLEEISNSIGNKLSIDNLTGGNGIEIVKNTSENKVEVKINNEGFTLGDKSPDSFSDYVDYGSSEIYLKQQGASGGVKLDRQSVSVIDNSGAQGVFVGYYGITRKTYSEGGLVTYDFLNEQNVKTINGQNIYGSGDISVGDKETKVVLSEKIWGSVGSTTFTIDTSVSNLQDKTITALWFCIINAYNSDNQTQYSYSINITDLYNFRTSSGTQGAFSYSFQPPNVTTFPVVISRANNITTSYSNGTQNYSIPLKVDFGSNPAYIAVQYGFIYKGNSFTGSNVY